MRRTNLVLRYCVANTLNQTAELSCVLGIVKEPLNLSLFLQRSQISKDLLQFPANPRVRLDARLSVKSVLTIPVSSFSLVRLHHPR